MDGSFKAIIHIHRLNSMYCDCTLIGRKRICSVSSLAKYSRMLFKMVGTLLLSNRFVLVTTSCTLANINNVKMITANNVLVWFYLAQQRVVASAKHLLFFHS